MAFLAPCVPCTGARAASGAPARRRARAHVPRRQLTARLLPLRPEVTARVVPVLASAAQARHFLGGKARLLDRAAAGAAGALLLLLFGGGLSRALRVLLLAVCAGLPALVPWGRACLRNAALRRHAHTGVFLGCASAPAPAAPGRVRVAVADADGSAAAEGAASVEAGRVRAGMAAFALVVSDDPKFRTFDGVGAVYVPEAGAWIGDYPYVRRDHFQEVAVHADMLARADPWPATS